ncbi:molybdopterin-dependent oxidoreductase [Cognatishimia sp. WU-CL00825]|uniref:molybdopterin-dependent oxidoreductase n=1 Tax=Cognatishimia sp. WU-CL00825 TaxID=3127658 RepID=UPI0031084BE3
MRFYRVMRRSILAMGLAVWALGSAPVLAAGAADPIVLEVTSAGPGSEMVNFDLASLRAIGTTEIVTSTIWTDGVHRFSGVSLHDLLAHLGATGGTIQATAINDYAIKIPVSDATQDGPIVAFEMDGELMPRRAKGPLWIVYPFDSSAQFRTEAIYARSIWQLNRLHIIE